MENQPVVSNPVQQPNIPTSPKPKHKTFLTSKLFLITLIVVVLFTAVYAGIYLYLGSQLDKISKSSPTPLPAETSVKERDPTANWKTYRNEKYGFELKYPSDWEVYDYLDEEGKQLQITKGGPNQRERGVSWDDGASIVLFVSETGGQDGEEKGELFSYNDWSGSRNIEIQEYLRIDKITVSRKLPSGRTFFIIWEQIDPSNNGLTAEKFFLPILSTFKFTDKENQGVCTQDAKLCPDGSYVSRQGPNCEFAKCPQK